MMKFLKTEQIDDRLAWMFILFVPVFVSITYFNYALQ